MKIGTKYRFLYPYYITRNSLYKYTNKVSADLIFRVRFRWSADSRADTTGKQLKPPISRRWTNGSNASSFGSVKYSNKIVITISN